MSFSRYSKLINNGKMASFPEIKINKRNTDVFVTYNPNVTRLDRIAGDIYGDETLYWIILLANPGYYMEYDIPSGAVIRVPNPIADVITEFNSKLINNQFN